MLSIYETFEGCQILSVFKFEVILFSIACFFLVIMSFKFLICVLFSSFSVPALVLLVEVPQNGLLPWLFDWVPGLCAAFSASSSVFSSASAFSAAAFFSSSSLLLVV